MGRNSEASWVVLFSVSNKPQRKSHCSPESCLFFRNRNGTRMLTACQSGLFFCKWGSVCQRLCLGCKLFLRAFQDSCKFRMERERTPDQQMIELLVWGIILTFGRRAGDRGAQIWSQVLCAEESGRKPENVLLEKVIEWFLLWPQDHLLCWPSLFPSERSGCTTANRKAHLVCFAHKYLFAPILWLPFAKGTANSKGPWGERETFFEVIQPLCQSIWRFLAALSQVAFEAGASGSTRPRSLLWEGALSCAPQQILPALLNRNVAARHSH